jgi:hypothetical protein
VADSVKALTRWFIIPINPEPWAVGPVGVRNTSQGPKGFIGPNTQLVHYQNAIRTHLHVWYPEQKSVDEPCTLLFFFWRRLDRYVTPGDRAHARHVADATNLQKATEDALQPDIISNDRFVQSVASDIVEQSPDTDPGIIIALTTPYIAEHRVLIPEEVRLAFNQMRDKENSLDLGNQL